MKMPRAPERADGSTIEPGPRKRSRPCHSLGGDGICVEVLHFRNSIRLRGLGRPLRGSRRSHQRGRQASCGQQLLGAFRHVLLLHLGHAVGRFIADGLPHGFKNTRLGEGLAPILLKSRKPNNTEKLGES
jgi:hypothetical protein